MAVETEELYTNLNKLLADICKFLSDETNFEKLSPYARKQANELIGRSKHQLQEIARISLNNECNGEYVDMERKPSALQKDDDKNNIYSSVEDTTVQAIPKPNPYADLPAKELSQDIKCGALSLKTRVIFNFEKTKRIYGGIHNNWLLIYSCEKDARPLQCFDLKVHVAKNAQCKQGKNLPQDFELTCTAEEKKSFYFIAQTHKDMLQWVAHIERCHNSVMRSSTSSLTEKEEDDETYDLIVCKPKENSEDDTESIYHDIDILAAPKTIEVKPPSLPLRRPIPAKIDTPLPPIPVSPARSPVLSNLDSEEESIISYDPVEANESDDNSFSQGDEEDNIYEAFVTKPLETSNPSQSYNNKDDSKKNTSLIRREVLTPNNKPALKEKPKGLVLVRKH